MSEDEKSLLANLQGSLRAHGLLCQEICKVMPTAERKRVIEGLEERRDQPPGAMSDITPESTACREVLGLLIRRLEGQVSENDELKRLRREIGQLIGDVETLYKRADTAYGEALACSLILIQMLRDQRRRGPAVVDGYLNTSVRSRPGVGPGSPVGILAELALQELSNLIRR